jgi:hypothetical protein
MKDKSDMAEYGEWNRKGAVLSDVTAQKEYGVTRDFIVKGIQVGRGVHRLRMTRGRAVTAAVIRRTKVRAALQDLTRNLDFGLAGVVARVLTTAPD